MANVTWKIARRSNAQLPLVIVVALAVVLVLLGKAQTAMFDRARMRISDWMQPGLSLAYAPVVAVNRWLGSTGELFHVYRENLALKDENARLRQWRNVAVVSQAQVRRYQALLHVVPAPDIHSVLAHVIGRANRPFLETLILDAGAAAQVKPGEAVLDASGMIGRIYLAGARTSWVILLTDLNSHVPVSIITGNAKGASIQAMMSGDNSAMPTLDSLPQTTNLHNGDQVISSGDGGLLPPGLPVGTVVESGGVYRIALLADPASSDEVEVLAFRKAPEDLPAATQAELPAVAAGLRPASAAPASAVSGLHALPTPASRLPQPVMPAGSLGHPPVPVPVQVLPSPATQAQVRPGAANPAVIAATPAPRANGHE